MEGNEQYGQANQQSRSTDVHIFVAVPLSHNQPTNQPTFRSLQRYESFLSNIGEKVEIKNHLKFSNNINPSLVTGEIVYFENAQEEVLFSVPSLRMESKSKDYELPIPPVFCSEAIGAKGNSMVNGRMMAEKTPVCILWNDCEQQFSPETNIWDTFGVNPAVVFIIIDPLKGEEEGYYRVRIYCDPESGNIVNNNVKRVGPLQHGQVVGGGLLASLVRQTALGVCREIVNHERENGNSVANREQAFVKRQRVIDRMAEQISKENFSSIMSDLF